jgi:YVTN family beta-propeller protein
MVRLGACVLAALLFLSLEFLQADDAPTTPYKVLKKITVGGEGDWDYITMDPEARRLYISRATRVQVVDVDKDKVVGEVADTPGVHGIALVPKLNRGFSSNGGDDSVTVFDLETLKQVARVKVGKRPDGIIYDPTLDRVFTFNAGNRGAPGDVTVIDPGEAKVVGSVKLDGKPESAVSDEKGMIYVNLEDKDVVAVIDAKDLAVKERYKVAPGKAPVGLSMDRKNRRLFVSCGNAKMVVLDADKGHVIATLDIGKGTDFCCFDPGTGVAFSSNGDGTLTMVKDKGDDHFEVLANVPTQAGARTMSLDTKTHTVYLVTAKRKAADAKAKGRGAIEPGSFVVLVVGPEKGS